MVSEAAVTAAKVLAGCTTLGMVTSPIVSVRRIARQQRVGLVSLVPFVSLLANSHVWMMYGLLTRRYFPVFSMFLLGDVLAAAYLAVYWRFTTERAYMKRVLGAALAFLALMTAYVVLGALGRTGQSRHAVTLTLGAVSDVVSVCLYASPMEKIVLVLRHRSAAFFNLPMVLAALANNAAWLTYGHVTDNWFIVGPNILFLALGSLTLALYVKFDPKTHPVSGLGQPSACLERGAHELRVSVELSPSAAWPPTASKKLATERLASSPTYEAVHSPLRPLQLQPQPPTREGADGAA